jgi:hypothetical protein
MPFYPSIQHAAGISHQLENTDLGAVPGKTCRIVVKNRFLKVFRDMRLLFSKIKIITDILFQKQIHESGLI